MSTERVSMNDAPSSSNISHAISMRECPSKKSSINIRASPSTSNKSLIRDVPVTPVVAGVVAPVSSNPPLSVTGSTVCRICHTNTVNEILISPCHCKGSMAYVHLSCLERWLNQSSRSYCELCMYQYNAIETQRYGLCEGLRLWIRHPRNRTHFQSDILISVLLTIVTVGLVVVCLFGMQYFVLEGKKLGISKVWTRGAICFFLAIVIAGYLITLYLLIKDQVVPWYHWWKNTVDVRLLLTPSVIQGTRQTTIETTI